MKIQKRDCGIKIKFYDIEVGWTQINLKIGDKEIDFRATYCWGDGIEDIINAIFCLNPNLGGMYDCDHNHIDYLETPIKEEGETRIYDIPVGAELSFDEEGSIVDLEFEREQTLNIDCNLKIHITIKREKIENYEFNVRFVDFCYALAKACTEMIKEYGFIGYWKSYWRRSFSLRQLLEIKAVALDNYDYVKTIFDNNSEKSDINKELEFLLMDM